MRKCFVFEGRGAEKTMRIGHALDRVAEACDQHGEASWSEAGVDSDASGG